LAHKLSQILVDGPSKEAPVPRHSASILHILLTPIVIENLPRGIRSGPLLKKWQEADVDAKWVESKPAKARAKTERRRQLTDFERFKVMILKKQVSKSLRMAASRFSPSM
jgi:large subunit ribosomal protein L14e